MLKVVYVNPAPAGAEPIDIPNLSKIALVVLSIGIVLIGTASAPWFDWAMQAAQDLF